MKYGSYICAFGDIRISQKVENLLKEDRSLELGIERFAELLFRLGLRLTLVDDRGVGVEIPPPPPPWKPAPWQQGFPGPLEEHMPGCTGKHSITSEGKACDVTPPRKRRRTDCHDYDGVCVFDVECEKGGCIL